MSAPVDVLAVLDRAAQQYASLRDDCDSNDDTGTGDGYERERVKVREAHAAVRKLAEAAKYAEAWIDEAKRQGCALPCENTLNDLRDALARIGGAK